MEMESGLFEFCFVLALLLEAFLSASTPLWQWHISFRRLKIYLSLQILDFSKTLLTGFAPPGWTNMNLNQSQVAFLFSLSRLGIPLQVVM